MGEKYKENSFEDEIENYLLSEGGYLKGDPENFDPSVALDKYILIEFFKKTQQAKWNYIEKIQKDKTKETILNDLVQVLNSEHEGVLKVLRHGFKCFGKNFKVAYFDPSNNLNPETKANK